MRCPSCNYENRLDRRFCAKCGVPLGNPCAACGTQNEPDENFCGSCGEPLRGAPRTSAADGDRRPRAGADAPYDPSLAAERRQLTVMFCDLVGSTDLAQRLDAEDLRSVVRAYQESASQAIKRYEGHIAQYLGDGLLVYFGYPQAHEDDAERAVRAGLEILSALGTLNDTLEPKYAMRLAARVGIHTGPVVIGEMGGGTKSEVLAVGDTTNIAARVESTAEPDSVLITAATHRLVAGLFVVDERGAEPLKGVSEPVPLYRVRQAAGIRGRLALAAARGLTPFTGREDELRFLMNRWELAQDGEGQAVLIIGEAGIGKSRLVQQFRTELSGTPHSWFECAGSAFHQHSPFYVVSDLLQQAFAWRGEESTDVRLDGLATALQMAGFDPADTVPLVAPLLGLPVPPDRFPPPLLSAEQQRKKLLATVVAWTFLAARVQPTILVTEDLHWVDPSTLELLGLLVEEGAREPLFLLCTARPDFRAPWSMPAHHAELMLDRLDKRHVREMITRLMSQFVPPEPVVETLVARADGVPLFVEELTRGVLETARASITTREIPPTLRDSLMARLDRLGAAKDVAQVASVVGREFSYVLLREVVGGKPAELLREDDLQAALAKLGDAELIYARGVPPEATYAFKHALIQETAYESLLKSRRRELHRAVAEALVNEGSAAAQPAVLAYHREAAGEVEAAVTAWQQAAEQAQRTAAVREAEAHYRRALAALATLRDGPARSQIELPLQVALFFLLTITRGPGDPATEEAITRAAALAEQLGDGPQAVLVLAGSWAAAYVRNEHRAGLAIARQMVRLAERGGEALPRAMAQFGMGASLIVLGELDAGRAHLERVLALWNDDDFRWFPQNLKILSLGNLAYAACVAGRSDSARQREEESATAATQCGVPSDAAMEEAFAMAIAGLRRESAGMAERARRFLKLCADHDLSLFLPGAQVFGGWILACEEDPAEGIALLREGLRCEQAEGGAKSLLALHLSLLAEVYAQGGALTEALATLDEAFAALGDEEIWRPDLLRLRGDLLLAECGLRDGESGANPQLKEAERCYREAIERAHGMGATAFELRATTRLGRLLQSQGHGTEARALLAPLYASFTEGLDTRDLRDAKVLLDDLR